jgi:hypothetical protein
MTCGRIARALVSTSLVFGLLAVPGHPQRGTTVPSYSPPSSNQQQPFPNTKTSDTDDTRVAIEARQVKARNDDRQKRLVADTDKLLALATQLHEDVGKTDKNILSLDVVKRADEIEKLAHSVKERMKG